MTFPSFYTFEPVDRPVPQCIFCDRIHTQELSMFAVATKDHSLYKYVCESCLSFFLIKYNEYNKKMMAVSKQIEEAISK